MAGIRGGGGVQTNVSLAKKSEVNDSVNSVTSIRLHKRWGFNTLQYSHPSTRPVTHLALSCNALYTWLTYISNYHNNRTLIIGEKSIKILFASKYFLFVVVTTNSVSSRAILPVMVVASTPKTGMVILRGLFHESFVSVTHRLVCYRETLLLSILTIILLYDPSLTCKFTPTLQAHTRWFKWACSHDW